MHRFLIIIEKIEQVISFTALAALFLCVLFGVLSRYVTEQPAPWTSELSGIMFTWVVFIGSATAMRRSEHVSVPLLVDLLPRKVAFVVRRLSQLAILSFLVCVTWLSYHMMLQGASRPSPVLRIPFSMIYLATFIAFAEMSVTTALRLIGLMPSSSNDLKAEVL